MADIITGDSRPYVANLTINGAPFVIPPTAKVQVALVSTDKSKKLLNPITVDSTITGADWAVSKVVFRFSRVATGGIKDFGKALVEIQVELPDGTDTSDWTWWIPINIVRGNIA